MVKTVEVLSLADRRIDRIMESVEEALGPHGAADLFLEVLLTRLNESTEGTTVRQYRSDPWLKAQAALAALAREARIELNGGPSEVGKANREMLEELWTLMKEVEGS
jgi:hypothetical protein